MPLLRHADHIVATCLENKNRNFIIFTENVIMKAIRNKGILMYQIEVKLNLIKKKFNPKDGWKVTVDIDSMEMGKGSQQKPEKKEIAEKCWRELNYHILFSSTILNP